MSSLSDEEFFASSTPRPPSAPRSSKRARDQRRSPEKPGTTASPSATPKGPQKKSRSQSYGPESQPASETEDTPTPAARSPALPDPATSTVPQATPLATPRAVPALPLSASLPTPPTTYSLSAPPLPPGSPPAPPGSPSPLPVMSHQPTQAASTAMPPQTTGPPLQPPSAPVAPATVTSPGGLIHLAPPAGGWPRVELAYPPRFGVKADLFELWAQKTWFKLFVRVFLAAHAVNAQHTVARIKDTLMRFLDAQASEITVSQPIPDPDRPPMGNYPHPWHFLVTTASPQHGQALVQQECINTHDITLLLVPWTPEPMKYVGTVGDFSLTSGRADCDLACEIIKHALDLNHALASFVTQHSLSGSPFAYSQAIHSIRVEGCDLLVSGGRSEAVWHVYCEDPPSLTPAHYNQWVCMIRGLSFSHVDHGVATFRNGSRQLSCVGCKGSNHPYALCRFPQIPGWQGPVPNNQNNTIFAATGINNGRGRGASRGRGAGRGRGRGRGN
ncbi:hypothetical protein CONPUDRAFT_148290 [Coniophora puteana RWD-64-598 SS2]|uniref:Uncharacterized protein n=1 Tax=Coniophora puteana (strain RWD-64-598) TaxID=741705 RepID=A0A5M3N435_CONPW|nr:uncharacterized protein CONPUDRAFT_148290 [Coniophora puteana RWD-64-598 SS2]EIW86189.1 hypothetical protein CONPUDRAFT_148290 [Coniophora puteana RWD-64-598 SS2]